MRLRVRLRVWVCVFCALGEPPEQVGDLSQFHFQTLLLTLVSSIALLATAAAVVNFLAFSVMPNRFIYDQYANATVGAAPRSTAVRVCLRARVGV